MRRSSLAALFATAAPVATAAPIVPRLLSELDHSEAHSFYLSGVLVFVLFFVVTFAAFYLGNRRSYTRLDEEKSQADDPRVQELEAKLAAAEARALKAESRAQ